MSGSQLTAKIKESSPRGASLIFAYVPLLCCMNPLFLSCRSPVFFRKNGCCPCIPIFSMEMYCLFMQISFFPNKRFQGLSIILNKCAERHLLLIRRVLKPWFNRRKRVAGTKKICTSAARKPFFGTDTRWEPVINIFHWTRHFGSPESVPHKYIGFYAEPLR